MPKVSVNILTKNRQSQLKQAIESVLKQTFKDLEIIVVNDGSTDGTEEMLKNFSALGGQIPNKFQIINHQISKGITLSRQEALEVSAGEYVAILDDDDEWIDPEKLKKQVEFLDGHPDYVLAGGGIKISNIKYQILKFRPESDRAIRNWILLKNPVFTSTAMFSRKAAIKAGGFVKDEIDLTEDYDLWLRLGKIGKIYNFPRPFALYAAPDYNKDKFRLFLQKQSKLISRHKNSYPFFWPANVILKLRQFF